MKEQEPREQGNKGTGEQEIPEALRICLRCGELAAGAACAKCVEIERTSTRWALELLEKGVDRPSWMSAPADLADELLRLLTEEKLEALRAERERSRMAAGPVYHECPGCRVEVHQPGYCPDCLAAPAGSWKRTELAAGRHYAEEGGRAARGLRAWIYISLLVAGWLWAMWPFRERIAQWF